jgi:hypothetical protein
MAYNVVAERDNETVRMRQLELDHGNCQGAGLGE